MRLQQQLFCQRYYCCWTLSADSAVGFAVCYFISSPDGKSELNSDPIFIHPLLNLSGAKVK